MIGRTNANSNLINESMVFSDSLKEHTVENGKYYIALRTPRVASLSADAIPSITGAELISTLMRYFITSNTTGGNVAISCYLLKATSTTITFDKGLYLAQVNL